MSITTPINIEYLIDPLRLRLGDIVPASYRYLDEWLRVALIQAVKKAGRYWNYKYLVDESNVVSRNPHLSFLLSEPPIIETPDEDIIVIMAAIIVLEGSLENSAWSAASWRDAEIAVSNLEQFRTRSGTIASLIAELNQLILSPTKRLVWASKQSLPGYKGNTYERIDETA
jgi:hypothetical protein